MDSYFLSISWTSVLPRLYSCGFTCLACPSPFTLQMSLSFSKNLLFLAPWALWTVSLVPVQIGKDDIKWSIYQVIHRERIDGVAGKETGGKSIQIQINIPELQRGMKCPWYHIKHLFVINLSSASVICKMV